MIGRHNAGYTNVQKSLRNIPAMICYKQNSKVVGFGMIAQIIPIIKVIRGRLLATLHRYICVDWTLACYFLLPSGHRPLCKLFGPNLWSIDCIWTIGCLSSSWALLLALWGWKEVFTTVLFASAHRHCLTGFGWWQSHHCLYPPALLILQRGVAGSNHWL